MSATSVSVVFPVSGQPLDPAPVDQVRRYLETTGFTFEIVTAEAAGFGAGLRKGCADAKGTIIVIVDPPPRLAYPVGASGAAVAMGQSGGTHIVFAGTRADDPPRHPLLRALLVPILPDRSIHLDRKSTRLNSSHVSESR